MIDTLDIVRTIGSTAAVLVVLLRGVAYARDYRRLKAGVYRSLRLLAQGIDERVPDRSRVIRLAKNKTADLWWGALIAMLGALMLFNMALVAIAAIREGEKFPPEGVAIALILGLVAAIWARVNIKSVMANPLRRCAQVPGEFEFVAANITGYRETEQRVDATLMPGELVESFNRSVWPFRHEQLPLAAVLALRRSQPEQAALVGISRDAIQAAGANTERLHHGSWPFILGASATALPALMTVFSLLVIAPAIGLAAVALDACVIICIYRGYSRLGAQDKT